MSDTKQVIVMRKDLGMRKGKMIAQGCHASIAFLTKRLNPDIYPTPTTVHLKDVEADWMNDSFAKVCVGVNSLEELKEINQKAKQAGLECHMITDSGRTEFHGVPTPTCLAIGPDKVEKIDKITGHLKLL